MIIKKKFKDLFIVKNKILKDNRGYFKELLRENIIKKKFPFLVMSYSKKNRKKIKVRWQSKTMIKNKIYSYKKLKNWKPKKSNIDDIINLIK